MSNLRITINVFLGAIVLVCLPLAVSFAGVDQTTGIGILYTVMLIFAGVGLFVSLVWAVINHAE